MWTYRTKTLLASIFFCLIYVSIGCKSTKQSTETKTAKSTDYPVYKIVLTLENEEAVTYLTEKYNAYNLATSGKVAKSINQYLFEYTASRQDGIELKKNLVAEPLVIDLSNYIEPSSTTPNIQTGKGRKG